MASEHRHGTVAEWFKTNLDPRNLERHRAEDPEAVSESHEDVVRWYEDYLRFLYKHIEFTLSSELKEAAWDQAKIEFIFSVPTTWDNATVETFRSRIHKSGFADPRYPGHTVMIGLTEAEAAAVHVSTEGAGIFRVCWWTLGPWMG